jgi:hypothetical protein
MAKRPKHVAVCCDVCGEWTTVKVARLARVAGDPDRRRGVPCGITSKCTGRAREPEQLEMWPRGNLAGTLDAEQLGFWDER